MGADRSIATALPALLVEDALRLRVGLSIDEVGQGLEALAATPFDEARPRLVEQLCQAWHVPCGGEMSLHRIALEVARRMIATEGMVRLSSEVYGFGSVMLPEPLGDTIRQAEGLGIDIAGASFGVALLAAAACDCHHGRNARALLDVIIDYDRRVWPSEYARHRYHRTERWRQAIDAAVADRVMAGDEAALTAHLDGFAPVGEELRRFLLGAS
jgi:hypothetical protein